MEATKASSPKASPDDTEERIAARHFLDGWERFCLQSVESFFHLNAQVADLLRLPSESFPITQPAPSTSRTDSRTESDKSESSDRDDARSTPKAQSQQKNPAKKRTVKARKAKQKAAKKTTRQDTA